MATIVDGMVMGVRMYGEINTEDVKNFAQFTQAVECLRKALTTLFNAEVAELAMRRITESTHVEVKQGEVENLTEWERLYQSGMVFCKARGKENVSNAITE